MVNSDYPYNHCPICGVYTGDYPIGHKCNNRTLGAIDAANTRAINQEDENLIAFYQISDSMNNSLPEKLKDYERMLFPEDFP